MAMELDRSFQALQGQDDPPYFLSYEITQDEVVSISGAFGQVTGSEKSVNRILDVDIRVGDYFVDNTHPVNVPFGGLGDIFDLGLPSVIPVDDPEALRTVLWSHTDKEYKQAVTQLTNVQSILQAQVEKDDQSGDFSQTPTETYAEETKNLIVDEDLLKRKIRLYTQFFSDADHIRSNNASISTDIETRWFVNSEGTKVKVSHPYFRLVISASTKADDGMVLSKSLTFEGTSQESLSKTHKLSPMYSN